eukprot:807073-Rhodomonas_salina.1
MSQCIPLLPTTDRLQIARRRRANRGGARRRRANLYAHRGRSPLRFLHTSESSEKGGKPARHIPRGICMHSVAR